MYDLYRYLNAIHKMNYQSVTPHLECLPSAGFVGAMALLEPMGNKQRGGRGESSKRSSQRQGERWRGTGRLRNMPKDAVASRAGLDMGMKGRMAGALAIHSGLGMFEVNFTHGVDVVG